MAEAVGSDPDMWDAVFSDPAVPLDRPLLVVDDLPHLPEIRLLLDEHSSGAAGGGARADLVVLVVVRVERR